jgi:hypothetical protein
MAKKQLGSARAMIGYGDGRVDPIGPKMRNVGQLRAYYRDDNGVRTQAVPQQRPAFMKPRYG